MPSVQEPAVIVKWPGGNSTKLAVEGSEVRVLEARHEDDQYRLQSIIPLQEAVQFAVNLLEFVQATAQITAEEAELLEWMRSEEAKRENAYDALQAHWDFD